MNGAKAFFDTNVLLYMYGGDRGKRERAKELFRQYAHSGGSSTLRGRVAETGHAASRFTVFNVGGNKYRVIVTMKYRWQMVYVRHVLTHQEYDLGKWKRP
jgi:predicted nucleic acid-binding protein